MTQAHDRDAAGDPDSGSPAAVLVVGAGFAGLGTAIRLRQAGITDIVILERSREVGGTWRDNTYPGAACDVPSLLYSFSFAQNPDWSRTYSGSAEILDYIHGLVERFDLGKLIQFDTEATGLVWDAEDGTWTAHTRGGRTVTARAAVMAAGPLSNASLPDMPGRDTYTGTVIHSARWDHTFDPTGKRIAVIGTGASGVQIIPSLVEQAAQVKVFQRTAGWVIPRLDRQRSEASKTLFRAAPSLQKLARQAWFWAHEVFALGVVWTSLATTVLERLAGAYRRRQVHDSWLRRQLTPDYRAGCKRILVSSDYYPALQRDNCKLITWPIASLSPRGIRTADGIEHELDAIVFATGFDVCKTSAPFPVHGVDGASLDDAWAEGAHAYRSVTTAGFPNLFLTFGPNSGPGHNSALVYMESQIAHITGAVKVLVDRDLRALEVRRDREQDHNRWLARRLARTTWNSGCHSWYLTADGRNTTMYPGFATQFAKHTASIDLADYQIQQRSVSSLGVQPDLGGRL